jgi:beta-aspartyl-dipeptidase (metallo-type)
MADTTERPGGSRALLRLRGARVLDGGPPDLVLAGGRIVARLDPGDDVTLPAALTEELDLAGQVLLPALVDLHCHPVGGGGSDGPGSQCEPIPAEAFARAGIGTLAGVLGYDTATRRPEGLLGRVRKLRALGFGAHMYTGEIAWPPVTITGALGRDIALLSEVRGVKGAIAERGDGITTTEQLLTAVGEARRGSRTGGKPAIVHLHVGEAGEGFAVVRDALARDLVPAGVLTLTHVNWSAELSQAAVELGRAGVNLDLTACIRPDYFPGSITPRRSLEILLDGGVPAERITVSSDAGGAHRTPEGEVVGHEPRLLLEALQDVLDAGLLDPGEAVALFTRNPADRLGLPSAGRLDPGADADLLVLDETFSRGRLMLKGTWCQEEVA